MENTSLLDMRVMLKAINRILQEKNLASSLQIITSSVVDDLLISSRYLVSRLEFIPECFCKFEFSEA